MMCVYKANHTLQLPPKKNTNQAKLFHSLKTGEWKSWMQFPLSYTPNGKNKTVHSRSLTFHESPTPALIIGRLRQIYHFTISSRFLLLANNNHTNVWVCVCYRLNFSLATDGENRFTHTRFTVLLINFPSFSAPFVLAHDHKHNNKHTYTHTHTHRLNQTRTLDTLRTWIRK